MYQANQRQGSHKTKSRAEVSPVHPTRRCIARRVLETLVPVRKRSGVRRVVVVIFLLGVTRDYSYRLPRKAIRLATRMAIASKIQRQKRSLLLTSLKFEKPATTREMASDALAALELGWSVTTLIAVEERNANAYKSARNIPGVSLADGC